MPSRKQQLAVFFSSVVIVAILESIFHLVG
jgi:hypothetical protein